MMKRKLVLFLLLCLSFNSVISQELCYSEDTQRKEAAVASKNTRITNAEYVAFVPRNCKAAISKISQSDSELLVQSEKGTFYQLDASNNDIKSITEDDGVVIEKNSVFAASETLQYESLWATEDQLDVLQPEEPEWNLDMISSDGDTIVSESAEPVKVAVLDSGVEWLSDIDLKGDVNLVIEEQDVPSYMCDMTGHGTAVASIISSINPAAEIYSVRILDVNNRTTLERIIRGLYWCVDNEVKVINMSFGSSQYSEILENVINEVTASGIIVIAAAGNSGEQGVEYPAAYENVIAVGSLDNHGQKSDFSAEGDEIDVVAPGESIQVQSMLGMYTWVKGTSMSAPHVTAEASLILQQDNSKDCSFVKGLIKETAKRINDNNCGSGIIDIHRANEYFDEYESNYNGSDEVGLPENEEVISDFSDEEVSYEGRWDIENHFSDLIGNHDDVIYNGNVTTTAMRAIKRGAGFNDLEKTSPVGGTKVFKGCWHGQYRLKNSEDNTGYHELNYVAAYRLIRKIANLGGDVSDLPVNNPYSWIVNSSYKNIYRKFENGGIGNKTWADAIDQKPTGTYNAATQNIVDNVYYAPQIYTGTTAHKKALRKCFLYGMALHHVADTFCHSTFVYKQFDSMIVHAGFNASSEHIASGETTYFPYEYAHDLSFKPNRFNDAKAAAQRVVLACAGESVSISETYRPDPSIAVESPTGYRGYRLGRIWTYARTVTGDSESVLESFFDTIHYKAPINENDNE